MPSPHLPTLRDLLALDIPTDVRLSPDGARAAISVRRTNWNQNRYENLCLIYSPEHERAVPLTRSGSVSQIEWLDDHTLALLKSSGADDDKPQVWLYENLAGEGWQVTQHKTGVNSFKPFARGLLYLGSDPDRDEKKARQDKFGTLLHFEQEDSASALYYTGFDQVRRCQDQQRAITEDEAKKLTSPVVELSKLLDQPLHIANIVPSPQGDAVYLNCWPRDDLVYYRQGSVYCLQLDAPAAVGRPRRPGRVSAPRGGKEGRKAGGKRVLGGKNAAG